MKKIHLILQGKGGVGKSLIASLLMQYLQKKSYNVIAIDTDPVNSTLHGYSKLNVQLLGLWSDLTIDSGKFDEITATIDKADDNTHIIIDNGASGFVPFLGYLLENETVDYWKNIGIDVIFHTIVTGGQAFNDTINGLGALGENFKKEKIIIWKNRYFGEIERNGVSLEEFPIYKSLRDNKSIQAVLNIPVKSEGTFGKDLKEMFSRHQTFAEADLDNTLSLMTRQRLRIWWRDMCTILDEARDIFTAGTTQSDIKQQSLITDINHQQDHTETDKEADEPTFRNRKERRKYFREMARKNNNDA